MPFYDYAHDSELTACPLQMPDVLRPYEKRDELLLCPDCTLPLQRIWTVSSQKRSAEDNIPGGLWLENYGPEPVKVYSHTERKKLLKVGADGNVRRDKIAEMVRHVSVPGTDRSPHTVDWSAGSIDAVTLDNARILVSRPASQDAGREASRDPEDVVNDPRSATHPPSYLRLFNETQVIRKP
jgi:hypothetical protein